MKYIYTLILSFAYSSFVKLGIISAFCFILDTILFYFLIYFIPIFWSNIISSTFALTLDFLFATKFIFYNNKLPKYNLLIFIFYFIYSYAVIVLISFLIVYINIYFNNPVFVKIILIPLSYFLYWIFYKFFFNVRK